MLCFSGFGTTFSLGAPVQIGERGRKIHEGKKKRKTQNFAPFNPKC